MSSADVSDAARKLGERLLAKAQLTAAEVQQAVIEARAAAAEEARQRRLVRLATELRLVVEMHNAAERNAAVRGILEKLAEAMK